MSSPFARTVAATARTSDAIMGEGFTLYPMTAPADVNDRKIADVDRQQVAFTGIFGEPSARAGSGPVMRVGVKADERAHATDRPFVSVRLDQFVNRPQVGDKIVRLSDNSAFSIAEILPDGQGLARIDLNRT